MNSFIHQYTKTHFRINSNYDSVNGFKDNEQCDLFGAEVQRLLEGVGFTLKEKSFNYGCPEMLLGKQRLYCHPDDLSGYIFKEYIPVIENAIAGSSLLSLRWTDTYEDVYDMDENTLKNKLQGYSEELKEVMFTLFRTKNRNQYYKINRLQDWKCYVTNKVAKKLSFIENSPLIKQTDEFLNVLFVEQLSQGRIISINSPSGTGYRSLNKAEIKKHKNKSPVFTHEKQIGLFTNE